MSRINGNMRRCFTGRASKSPPIYLAFCHKHDVTYDPRYDPREANNWLLAQVSRRRRKAITGAIRFPWADKLISICGSLPAPPSISFRINAIQFYRGSLRNSSWRCNVEKLVLSAIFLLLQTTRLEIEHWSNHWSISLVLRTEQLFRCRLFATENPKTNFYK